MKDCTGKTILNMFTLGKTNLPEEFSFSTNNTTHFIPYKQQYHK